MTSIVGVDIGATGVRAVEVSTSGGSLAVKRAGTQPLPPGTVVAGAVADPVQVTAALKALWRKSRIKSKQVSLVLGGNQQVLVRTAVVAYLPNPALLRGLVEAEAKEALPVALESVYLDHHVLGVRTEMTDTPEGRRSRKVADVMIIGADRDVVDAMVTPCEDAGLQVVGIDIAPFALTRMVAAAGADSARLDFIVHFGAETVMLVGTVNGQTKVIRSLNEYAGKSVTLQIQDNFDLSLENAEKIKLEASRDLEDGMDSDATNLLNSWISAIVREVRTTMSHAQNGLHLPIGRVWLSGGGAHLGGLAGRLGAELGVPVNILDPRAWTTRPDKLRAAFASGQDLTLALAAAGK